jgi:hypothetical protein
MTLRESFSSHTQRESPMLIRDQFLSNSDFQIPTIQRNDLDLSLLSLISCDHVKILAPKEDQHKTVHFFADDNKLNRYYEHPANYVKRLAQYKHVMTPDFSLYPEMPFPLQLFNIFRNRWCGAYWQEFGLTVIPTISWSKKSFEFCFSGVESESIVAISTIGSRNNKSEFLEGFFAMTDIIKPSGIICLGIPFEEIQNEVIYVDYTKIRKGE